MSTQTPQQTERQLQRAVIEYGRLNGWLTAHFHDSRRQVRPGVFVGDRDAAGFPDLVMARGGRLVVAELKGEKGRVSADQQMWLGALHGVERATVAHVAEFADRGLARPCVEVYVWRPSDWASIEGTLQR